MFIAMNRFRIVAGREQEFIDIWKNRDSHLHKMPGFLSFHLLQGETTDEATSFISHTSWSSAEDFSNWTHSEAFRQAHAKAGDSPRDIYLGPPQFEGYEAVLSN
jgi:heme-degrading monooxygenase HmoA